MAGVVRDDRGGGGFQQHHQRQEQEKTMIEATQTTTDVIVTLTAQQMRTATEGGLARYDTAIARNYARDYRDDQRNRGSDDIRGAAGEMAVGIYTGHGWSVRLDAFMSEADVGDNIDVRCTSYPNGHLALYRDKDDADRLHVLVIEVQPGTYRIVGGIVGRDAMVDRYWTTHHRDKPLPFPAYWVPQSDLNIGLLPRAT